jgi:hypothetical protein
VVLFNQTKGSLLSVPLLHASTDIVPRLMQIAHFTLATYGIVTVLMWVTAGLLFGLPEFRKKRSQVSVMGDMIS